MIKSDKNYTITGIGFAIFATFVFIFLSIKLIDFYNWPKKYDKKNIKSNEIKTQKNLKLIFNAQKKYFNLKLENKKASYARYIVYLWTTFDKDKTAIKLQLIPKDLAFAMGPSRAVSGYFYRSIHKCKGNDNTIKEINYENNWVFAAIPKIRRITGINYYLVNKTGKIYQKKLPFLPSFFSCNPENNGWTIAK